MLSIFGFCQKDMQAVTKLSITQIKSTLAVLCTKLRGANSGNMAFHALLNGFKIDGTLNDEDIFTDEMKQIILSIDPEIQFRFPPGRIKQCAN